MDTKKGQKRTTNFCCVACDFSTEHKAKYERHINTRKHLKRINDTKMIHNDTKKDEKVKEINLYVCKCGKKYKYHSGLYRHKNTCEYKEETVKNDDIKVKENDQIIIDLLKKMDEKDKQIMELIPKVGNNNNNTTNNTNQFNLQVFLNEDCKDAVNWSEFINSIELDLDCLKELKDSNITKSISDIVCNKINELGIYKRPIHCVDQKRKKLCIKNEEDWENEDECVNALITKGDRKIQHEYIKLINQLEKDHPDWVNDPKLTEEYMEIANKVYQNVDDGKHRAELIKWSIIPK